MGRNHQKRRDTLTQDIFETILTITKNRPRMRNKALQFVNWELFFENCEMKSPIF